MKDALTVAERPLTKYMQVRRALAKARHWFDRELIRAAKRKKIKDVAEEHMFYMRAEGYKIVYDRQGWSVSFKQKRSQK